MENDDNQDIIELPGQPIPASRPRVTRFKNTYDPKFKEKKIAKSIIAKQWQRDPLNQPLNVSIEFHMPIPLSWSQNKRTSHQGIPHVSRPDTDNLLKFCLDTMNGIVFQDDSCVYGIHALKVYSEQPKTIIKIKSDKHDTK
jgi:Holliday junction resolvase RusA-like endonuclease